MIGRPIKLLRRWGVSWRGIAKCMVGFHWAWAHDRALVCGRCGRVIVKARPLPEEVG